jgi:dienelactone hydrolase
MRPLPAATLLAVLAAAPLPAQVAEEVLTIPSPRGPIAATLALPEGAEAPPAVLLLHGFTGSRDEMAIPSTDEGIFARTARLLAEAGYASLRIDFIGSGESGGDFADTTFEGQVADGLAALAWLGAEPRVAGDELFLIGWSQGGLVATAVAGRSGVPDAVALWAAVAEPRATFAGILGEEAVEAGLAAGDTPVTVTLPWGAEIGLRQGFFEGLTTFDPTAEIAAYDGPLFVAHGTLDDIVPPSAADLLIAAHDGPSEQWMREMDHSFNVFTDTATLDAMVAATIAFFDAHAD